MWLNSYLISCFWLAILLIYCPLQTIYVCKFMCDSKSFHLFKIIVWISFCVIFIIKSSQIIACHSFLLEKIKHASNLSSTRGCCSTLRIPSSHGLVYYFHLEKKQTTSSACFLCYSFFQLGLGSSTVTVDVLQWPLPVCSLLFGDSPIYGFFCGTTLQNYLRKCVYFWIFFIEHI